MLKKIAKFFIKLIIVLLTLALIGLAAVAGWYFYSGYNLSKTTLENEDLISRVDKVEWSEDYIPLQYVSDYFQDAIVAVVPLIGMIIASVLSGSIIIEQVYGIPGIGKLLISSVTSRDFPLTQTLVVYIAVIIVVINFLVDIVIQIIDPRIRLADRG